MKKQPCAICREWFTLSKKAKTAEERTLCKKCRKAVKSLNG